MPWDVTVELENRPGTIADMGEAAAGAGVNLYIPVVGPEILPWLIP